MKLSKKIILIISCFLLLAIKNNLAFAQYPDYLKGNRNYILSGGHMGQGWYLDRTTLKVLQNNPPHYLITVDVVEVANADRGNTEITCRNNCRYSYDETRNKMFSYWQGTWHYVEPVGSMAQTGHEFSGEMAFYLATGKKFYGGKKWWDPYTGKYAATNFGKELYIRADRAETR